MPYKVHPLQRLFNYGRKYRGQIWLATILSLNKIVELAPPAIIGAAVDVVVQKQNSSLPSQTNTLDACSARRSRSVELKYNSPMLIITVGLPDVIYPSETRCN